MESDNRTPGERLREERERLGLSIAQFASAFDITEELARQMEADEATFEAWLKNLELDAIEEGRDASFSAIFDEFREIMGLSPDEFRAFLRVYTMPEPHRECQAILQAILNYQHEETRHLLRKVAEEEGWLDEFDL